MNKITYKVGQIVKNRRGLKRKITRITTQYISYEVKRGKLYFGGKCFNKTFKHWNKRKD